MSGLCCSSEGKESSPPEENAKRTLQEALALAMKMKAKRSRKPNQRLRAVGSSSMRKQGICITVHSLLDLYKESSTPHPALLPDNVPWMVTPVSAKADIEVVELL